MNKDTLDELTGKTKRHLCQLNDDFLIHKDAKRPFQSLIEEASFAGIDLVAISSFRPFDEQLAIWNLKASGKLALLSDDGEPLIFSSLSEEEIVFRILRWSALPGAGRHHLGTDIDVIDRNALPRNNYKVQLVPSEYSKGGIFEALTTWLDKRISDRESFGFYRPYDTDRGGVAPEMWHLSYRPRALDYLDQYDFETFNEFLKSDAYKDMLLREIVLQNAEKIYKQFVMNVNSNY